ncbi:D-alanyl-D-alanine carboxypeptidase/D-alanyl-D-alanine carboxypeptidase (penicillin-binding protein 5/6) [Thalassobacillus cyri]|uniref:D-alanyl-D-alanine carboxypeptidase/D-alanyl-D-alanine carboxypeptidase (Penicillin-binding protein 5/6) n=1 Tax=Thalassobacillus cyri TaxID=571932 RepID=A0A1H4AXW5_9BACI|nr:D-alanyl-D-alanine carboxypeptidase family protein [Thalassobacillus cyri]SEA40731.1 D-alanyl-D-alanine carboxypeptidase/D-alanyl-D-alanine carboxypeptidase (penicillin-binding protein 5/6) [Thalassobacillus cyri]
MNRIWIPVMILVLLFTLPLQKGLAAVDKQPATESEAAILMDGKSGQVLFEKNSDKKMFPASITKILTGIIAIEQGELDDKVIVSERARNVDGTRVYLKEGEEVPLKKLVQGLLMNSGNDAGIAIAEHLGGSVENFAQVMNTFAEEKAGIENSNFKNPHGLFDKDHYVTARDMAKITQYAMQNETFKEIVGTKELEWKGEEWETTIINHNRLLWRYDDATGAKTGWVTKSGHTLVGTAERGGMELIAVVLKAKNAEQSYTEAGTLFDYGFENYESATIPAGTTYEKDGIEYELEESLPYTKKKGTVITEKVTRKGYLLIEADNGILTTGELKQVTKASGEPVDQGKDEGVEDENSSWKDAIFQWFASLFSSK